MHQAIDVVRLAVVRNRYQRRHPVRVVPRIPTRLSAHKLRAIEFVLQRNEEAVTEQGFVRVGIGGAQGAQGFLVAKDAVAAVLDVLVSCTRSQKQWTFFGSGCCLEFRRALTIVPLVLVRHPQDVSDLVGHRLDAPGADGDLVDARVDDVGVPPDVAGARCGGGVRVGVPGDDDGVVVEAVVPCARHGSVVVQSISSVETPMAYQRHDGQLSCRQGGYSQASSFGSRHVIGRRF